MGSHVLIYSTTLIYGTLNMLNSMMLGEIFIGSTGMTLCAFM